MTDHDDYLGPFNDDTILAETVEGLIGQYGIKSAIETGTYRLGATTKWLAERVDQVYTIESNPDYFNKVQSTLYRYRNIQSIFGRSEVFLENCIFGRWNPTLYFLDAHWESDNPLLEELAIIAELDPSPIIVIHDFKVPNHPELGYDTYGGQDYDFEWVKPMLDRIKKPWTHFYNSEAVGARRGVLFIVPKESV